MNLPSLAKKVARKLKRILPGRALPPEKNLHNNLACDSLQTRIELLKADSFYSFWNQLQQTLFAWKNCDILLTCPMTHETVASLFPAKEIFLIADSSQLCSFYLKNKVKKFQSVGIISPELSFVLYQNHSLLTRYMQLCTAALITVAYSHSYPSLHQHLLLLHGTGFPLIQTLLTKNDSLVSQSYMPNGTYFYSSHSPALLPATDINWVTHIAYRMIQPIDITYPWIIKYGQVLQDDECQFKTLPEQYALAVIQPTNLNNVATTNRIEADFSWLIEGASTNGHASLISCYTGPNDTNMYALLVTLASRQVPHLHLYKNIGEWVLIQEKGVPLEEIKNQGKTKSVRLWLEVTETHLHAGASNNKLFNVRDTSLARNACLGLRLMGDNISISNMSINSC